MIVGESCEDGCEMALAADEENRNSGSTNGQQLKIPATKKRAGKGELRQSARIVGSLIRTHCCELMAIGTDSNHVEGHLSICHHHFQYHLAPLNITPHHRHRRSAIPHHLINKSYQDSRSEEHNPINTDTSEIGTKRCQFLSKLSFTWVCTPTHLPPMTNNLFTDILHARLGIRRR